MLNSESQVVAFLQLYGERNTHAAGIEDAKLGENPHVPALGQKRHPVSLGQSHGHEAGSDAASFLAGLLECGLGPFSVNLFAEEDVG